MGKNCVLKCIGRTKANGIAFHYHGSNRDENLSLLYINYKSYTVTVPHISGVGQTVFSYADILSFV